jgi:biotin transporter BioY
MFFDLFGVFVGVGWADLPACLAACLAAWLPGCLAGWLAGWLLAGWLAGWQTFDFYSREGVYKYCIDAAAPFSMF